VIGVYLNLITGQSARINRDTRSPYSEEEKKEVGREEENREEFNIRYGRAHSHMWQRIYADGRIARTNLLACGNV